MVLYALHRLNFPLKVEIVTKIIHFTDDLCIFTSVFACGALAASISVGIVIPSTWFVYLYKQTVSITVVVLSTVIKTGTTAQIE